LICGELPDWNKGIRRAYWQDGKNYRSICRRCHRCVCGDLHRDGRESQTGAQMTPHAWDARREGEEKMTTTDDAIEAIIYRLIEANMDEQDRKRAEAWLEARITAYQIVVELGWADKLIEG
jgi:hypothetical protein